MKTTDTLGRRIFDTAYGPETCHYATCRSEASHMFACAPTLDLPMLDEAPVCTAHVNVCVQRATDQHFVLVVHPLGAGYPRKEWRRIL